jgi:hypothetical protein
MGTTSNPQLEMRVHVCFAILHDMNHSSEVHRLASSIAGLVAVITEIINAKMKEANKTQVVAEAVLPQEADQPMAPEGWVGKKGVAEHFKVGARTVDNWMKKGLLPYIRIGKNVRFKLSEAEEAISRCFKVQGR